VAEFDWDDVGTWGAVPAHVDADASGNAVRGPVVAVDSTGNLAISNGRVIALCGVKDLVVVETADAILVCHRDAVQSIKQLQALLPREVV
jgi:mannose-1-phosphate guanylyltransferase